MVWAQRSVLGLHKGDQHALLSYSCRSALKAAMDAAKQQQQAARPHWHKKRKAEAAAGDVQPAVPANRPTSTGSDTAPTKVGWFGMESRGALDTGCKSVSLAPAVAEVPSNCSWQ